MQTGRNGLPDLLLSGDPVESSVSGKKAQLRTADPIPVGRYFIPKAIKDHRQKEPGIQWVGSAF